MKETIMNVQFTLTNKDLTKNMEIIRKECNSVLRSANVIGKALSDIKARDLWKDDYKSFEECASQFGIKKAQAYNLVKGYEVGEKRLLRKYNSNGDEIGVKKLNDEYSNTQCVELAKLKEDTEILKVLDEGIVSPSMSTKEIRDAIDHYKNPEKYEEKEEIQEQPEATENSVDETETPFAKNLTITLTEDDIKIVDNIGLTANDVDKLKDLLKKYLEA